MAEQKEVDIFDVMRAKVMRGEEIVVQGELGSVQATLHGAMIDRLLHETKRPVRAAYLPATTS